MIIFTIVSFCLLMLIGAIILIGTIASIEYSRKTPVIVFVLLVVASLIFAFVIPPFDEWSAKRYDEAIENVKIARVIYNPEIACKNDKTNYCLVINMKKLKTAINDSISTFRDYNAWNTKTSNEKLNEN